MGTTEVPIDTIDLQPRLQLHERASCRLLSWLGRPKGMCVSLLPRGAVASIIGMGNWESLLNQGGVMKNDLKTRSVISTAVFSLPPLLFISQNIHAYLDGGMRR